MDFITSKLIHFLSAARKVGAIKDFSVDLAVSENCHMTGEEVTVTYTEEAGRLRKFVSVLNCDNDRKAPESESSNILSDIMHSLHVHGADWLPEFLKEQAPEETPK